jgi:hypothetical protein
MPLASALELVLGHYDIYDVDSLVAILRSPHDASRVADLIDGSRALIDATAGTAHVSVQAEPASVTVGTTMESMVNVRQMGSMATFSAVTGARMVSSEVQYSPSQPQMVQRAVQATPAPAAPCVAMQNVAVNTVSWQEIKSSAMDVARTDARQEVLREFEPALEHAVVSVEVQATRAAAMLDEARELKEAVRAGFESQAREAAAASADRREAAEDRAAAMRERAHREGVIERLRARLEAVGDWSEA